MSIHFEKFFVICQSFFSNFSKISKKFFEEARISTKKAPFTGAKPIF